MAGENAAATKQPKSMDEIAKELEQMTLLSFRQTEEVRHLAHHFKYIIDHPITQKNKSVLTYLKNLNDMHRKAFTQQRDNVVVEYVFSPQTKSNLQRQRFNSISVTDVSELLRVEFLHTANAQQVHICTDCNVEIELNDEEPLMESLQRHFDLEVHQPKKEIIDVAEPIILPNMSRRKSAMVERGETIPVPMIENMEQVSKQPEHLERLFTAKLEASLIRHLPDNSEPCVNAALKYYRGVFVTLCRGLAAVDFTALTGSVAPIIMSIKDNVNQNYAADNNKNFENDDNEQQMSLDRPMKNQIKKYRYYGPIENNICKLLANHKLVSLTDDRTGKPAFFCLACEYYTLRFRYDSVLSHIFSETHIQNLSSILQADSYVPFYQEQRTPQNIKDLNEEFLLTHSVSSNNGTSMHCALCKVNIDSIEASVLHVLDENHLGRLSDKLFRKAKTANPDGQISDEWGPKSLDWAKFLAGTGKALSNKDNVVMENFIKPSGKVANYCSCCDITLKGPRQVLFNHIRQKKHLRNAAPHKLTMLFKNHCRPLEYYASFGNCYLCAICDMEFPMPSFSAVVDHFESEGHIESIAKLICFALLNENQPIEQSGQVESFIEYVEETQCYRCELCDMQFQNTKEVATHILSDIKHQTLVVEARYQANKGDIISAYLKASCILFSEGSSFTCVICLGVFNSLRALLAHLVFAEHFADKLPMGNIFRFYLELKHNINLLARNKYVYSEFGRMVCGVCEAPFEEGENAKRHVVSPRHRESMGVSYVNVSLDVAAE